jgi:hypothetical protein
LSPGNSAARVTFGGDLVLGYGTNLQIELGGTSPGAQFDQLQVAGKLSLDGKLNVSFINGFSPVPGNSFDILDWTTQTGIFSNVQLAPLANGLAWDTSQFYSAGIISVASAALSGDYNLNGVVDAADYVVWRKNAGSPQDYTTWRAHFGQPNGSGNSMAAAAVPEPTSITLLVVALLIAATMEPIRKLASAFQPEIESHPYPAATSMPRCSTFSASTKNNPPSPSAASTPSSLASKNPMSLRASSLGRFSASLGSRWALSLNGNLGQIIDKFSQSD